METKEKYIIVSHAGRKQLLAVEDILHIEAVRAYSVFYTRGSARQYVSAVNMGRVQKELNPELFLRVHRSHIINVKEIKSIQFKRGGKVTLSDNTIITVSQRRKSELLHHLKIKNKKSAEKKINVTKNYYASMQISTMKPHG